MKRCFLLVLCTLCLVSMGHAQKPLSEAEMYPHIEPVLHFEHIDHLNYKSKIMVGYARDHNRFHGILWRRDRNAYMFFPTPVRPQIQQAFYHGDTLLILANLQRDSLSRVYIIRSEPKRWQDWRRTYGESHFDEGHSMAIGPDGHLYLAGSAREADSDLWVVKIDAHTGDILWERRYGEREVDEQAFGLSWLPDGSLRVEGIRDAGGDVREIADFAVRFDTQGNRLGEE